jgi:hypothetical protein
MADADTVIGLADTMVKITRMSINLNKAIRNFLLIVASSPWVDEK